jgi:nucleoid-associated protein YgaU
MQKELKIGIAIGAVLLVVLIVYLAVPKNADTVASNTGGDTPTSVEEQNPAPAEEKSAAGPAKEQSAGGGEQRAPIDPFGPGNGADQPKPENQTVTGNPNEDVWGVALNTGQVKVTSTPPLMVSGPKTPAPPAAEPKVEGPAAKPAGPVGAGSGTGTTEPVVDTGAIADPPPPEPAKPEATPGARTHKVAKGETLSSIAKHVYGSDRFYLAIEKANPGIDSSRLRVGQTINLPDVDAVKKEDSEPARPQASSEKRADSDGEYVVKKGDNLHDIALKRLGSAALANDIYELNKATIGADSARLKIGQILKLPAKSALESSASR